MIIVQLTGGLGNQMFQYAFGKYIAEKHKTELKIDLSFFEHYKWHEYSLAPLNIDERIATVSETRSLRGDYAQLHKRAWVKFRNLVTHKSRITEPDLGFHRELLDLHDNIYLEGYWQCEKYFSGINDLIRRQFQVRIEPSAKNQAYLKQIDTENSVSLHVRRGNYANIPEVTKVHGLCSVEYYERAVSWMNERIESPFYFIFSDDINWARKNIKLDANHVFVDQNDAKTDYEDLRLMSRCKNNILANSTFSWWAAWLNSNDKKHIVAPIQWFADASRNSDDLIPSSWTRV